MNVWKLEHITYGLTAVPIANDLIVKCPEQYFCFFCACDSIILCIQDDETALHCAAARGHMECVQTLLDGGSPVDELDSHHRSALLCALENGHLDIALLLIHKGSNINEPDEKGNTPLHVASRLGLLSAVQTLCHCGADVDMTNQDSFTPLHLAAKEGFLDIVRVLCLARSNVCRKTKCTLVNASAASSLLQDGLTAEILALASEHTHVASLLAKMKTTPFREGYPITIAQAIQ
ncbi:ankyrin repeat protein [Oesophagostomum dentatum]|uniref:Ankyrin repeat protein n=1 Tax=Oesophagostomum dentatum TaxID=61180 RepID=A0A0B1TPY6_OESDE|nr:ankyrin repeat protein [Oesophagostomum dentatum]